VIPDDSYGGFGGTIILTSSGHVHVGVSAAPVALPLPAAPTTGTVVTTINANLTLPGNILIDGTVTTDALAGIRILTSTGGDIVVRGTLNAGDPGLGKALDLRLSAPNGTVYILGAINTFNTDGTNDGSAGGALLVDAGRIVVTGAINTHGEDHPGATAGKGGDVTFTIVPSGTDILFQGGSITTTGGASGGAAGGDGGKIQLLAL